MAGSAGGGEPFYVPYDQLKPMVNERGEAFVCIWQAFPWLKRFYTTFGACRCWWCLCLCPWLVAFRSTSPTTC
jgi:hypothetical protein